MTQMFRKYGPYAALLAIVALTGCGIKPKELSPPNPDKGIEFPKTYPAPDKN